TYRNPAFLETTPLDAYWGAKLVMAFTPREIGAIIDQGGYSDPAVAEYITRILVERREKVGRYWYSQVAPLDNFAVDPSGTVQFEDLGVTSGLWTSGAYHYRLVRHADGVEVDAGELVGATNVALPPAASAGDKGVVLLLRVPCRARRGNEQGGARVSARRRRSEAGARRSRHVSDA
ncbi:MAG: hypothetical protein ABGY41_14455, partial [Candidatus Poribacteria bacterium]